MKQLIYLALLLCVAWPAVAEDASTDTASDARSSEAIEILKKADEAARKVRAARFESSSKPSGFITNFMGALEGEGVVEGWDEEMERPRRYLSRIKTRAPGSDEAKELTGGGDGDTYFLIDHGAKKAYEDMDPGVMGSNGQALTSIGFVQFVHPTPFQRDLDAESVELLGQEEVAGEECYKIRVVYGGVGMEKESTWSISAADYLPRRRVRHFAVPQQGEGTLEVTISKLELDPELEASLFKLELPEGYEQIDDFAP